MEPATEQQNTITIPPEFEKRTRDLVVATKSMQVVTHEQYLMAGEHLKHIKLTQKAVVDKFSIPKKKAFEAHRAISELERSILDPLKAAERDCANKVSLFLNAERKRQEEERAAAQKAAEAKAKADAEESRKRQDEERLKTAELLEAQGFSEEAEAVLEDTAQPTPPPVPVMMQPVAKMERVQGVHDRKTYKAEIVDLMILVKEIAAGRQPISMVQANESVLNGMAKALKGELRIPGVRVVENSSIVTRTTTGQLAGGANGS